MSSSDNSAAVEFEVFDMMSKNPAATAGTLSWKFSRFQGDVFKNNMLPDLLQKLQQLQFHCSGFLSTKALKKCSNSAVFTVMPSDGDLEKWFGGKWKFFKKLNKFPQILTELQKATRDFFVACDLVLRPLGRDKSVVSGDSGLCAAIDSFMGHIDLMRYRCQDFVDAFSALDPQLNPGSGPGNRGFTIPRFESYFYEMFCGNDIMSGIVLAPAQIQLYDCVKFQDVGKEQEMESKDFLPDFWK
jgi:hypothetical protein